ncbi:MAG: hypothetical protein JSW07_13680, partial [bacterium]
PFRETVWASLENIVFSPNQEEILNHIVKAYAVVVIVEGEDAEENIMVHQTVTSTSRKIANIMDQLPKRIEEPPYILTISRESLIQEQILLWSLGIDDNKSNRPSIAILYGRGRRLGPILTREQITERDLYNILIVIGLSCECGLDIKIMMGSMIPLRWGKKIQSDVVKTLGFDGENPMVKLEISQILSLRPATMNEDNESIGSSFGTLGRYTEEVLDFNKNSKTTTLSPAQLQNLVSPGSMDFKSGLNLKVALFISGLFLLILSLGGFILIRAKRKDL